MEADTPYSVRDANGQRWPMLDGIVFARTSRRELAGHALHCLDSGDAEAALIALLSDQDDWWQGPVADPAALRRLVRERQSLSLREAMALLSWGPVADYFAHRWSDPTFLAGLTLMEAHWSSPTTAFELACGIGQYLRALAQQGVEVTGADVVFAKLWVARHWVVPQAELICFDAAIAPWPLDDRRRFGLIACHDAFYFLEPKGPILMQLRDMTDQRGTFAISHIHNRDWPNLSPGAAMTAAGISTMFPDGIFYDDAELTHAAIERRAPRAAPADALGGAEAFGVAAGPGLRPACRMSGMLAVAPDGTRLRRNPLYENGRIAWPSERYEREYGPRATYPMRATCPEQAIAGAATADWALRRELVDLPERW